ncbi:hypothetical protein MSAN_01943000 [Mycena sanguinolenta]|uniref:Cytochrome P450 n=1 Tax=Mycena sanguinolenta TaxID=230812 RepID=A0A8H7CRA6_9AGAR|nr:hypothetical protein MSAN_01943000 [Mycena sanguinolenta]
MLAGQPELWTSNVDIERQITAGSHRCDFMKPAWFTQTLVYWGMNIISAEGALWRKHRRIVGPAFGPKLYKLVWNKTLEIYRDMIQVDGWKDKNSVNIPVTQRITSKLTLLLISTCGFGFPTTWFLPISRDFFALELTNPRDTPPRAADGGMPIQEAFGIFSETIVLAASIPTWLWYLPIPGLREVRVARKRLMAFMQEQVAERKALVAAGDMRADAFTMMVEANQDQSNKYQLDDAELIGNVFVLMFAGHETTANSLAATLAYISLHQDIQNEVVEQIMSVVGPDRDPDYDDYSKLDKVLAIFYEAIRIMPTAHAFVREATEDTNLTVQNPVGEEGTKTIPILKGTQIIIDMVGVHYNPRYFEDPETYKPSRWYGLPADSEQIAAFGVGPRACLGRKFATVEATCFLALLLRDWQVLPLLRAGETKEAWGARVLTNPRVGLTMAAADFPIELARRKRV